MKKLILIAALAIVTAVVVPVASASADEYEFSGSCTITGSATFTTGLPPGPLTKALNDEYTFTSGKTLAGKDGTACAGIAKDITTNGPAEAASGTGEAGTASATVSGKGNLSCTASESIAPGGSGSITVAGKTAKFTGFEFTAAGSVVIFTIKGGASTAGGAATFATAVNGVKECALGPAPTKLEFTASASGKIN
jgi:hypothetical protein